MGTLVKGGLSSEASDVIVGKVGRNISIFGAAAERVPDDAILQLPADNVDLKGFK